MDIHPNNAPVPLEMRTERLWLRPIKASDVDLDYKAVMSSVGMLNRLNPEGWPSLKHTLEQNLADLTHHERKHQAGEAFTFTVLNPEGTHCLGCVYISPIRPREVPLCKGAASAADVGFWVRESELSNDLEEHLLSSLLEWFKTGWGIERVLFTISQLEKRQAVLFAKVGLKHLLDLRLPDGDPCWVFG